MRKRHEITEEQVAEIKKAQKKNKNANVEKRLTALILHAEGQSRKAIAEVTGYAVTYISEIVAKYCKNGISSMTENKYVGNHRNLSYAEEEALLEPFRRLAEAGQIVEISAIKKAYETAIGRSLGNAHGQIYYVLHRHGWRKVMPRSRHPKKASDEAIEASKKLKLASTT